MPSRSTGAPVSGRYRDRRDAACWWPVRGGIAPAETPPKPRAGHAGGMRVLVVEDDPEMAEAVAVGLRRERMAVDVALDGPGGLARALDNRYDVVVLDRDLPGL